jgi:hypothetical protein
MGNVFEVQDSASAEEQRRMDLKLHSTQSTALFDDHILNDHYGHSLVFGTEIVEKKDLHGSSDQANQSANDIKTVPAEHYVVVGVKYEASSNITFDAEAAVKYCGGSNKIDNIGWRHSYCLIGPKGASAVSDSVVEAHTTTSAAEEISLDVSGQDNSNRTVTLQKHVCPSLKGDAISVATLAALRNTEEAAGDFDFSATLKKQPRLFQRTHLALLRNSSEDGSAEVCVHSAAPTRVLFLPTAPFLRSIVFCFCMISL